jgi:hypothetical protein
MQFSEYAQQSRGTKNLTFHQKMKRGTPGEIAERRPQENES